MTKDACTKEKPNEDNMQLRTKWPSYFLCSTLYRYLLSYLYIFLYISIYNLIYNAVKLCLYKEQLI